MSFSKADTGRQENHRGLTFKCDATAEAIKAQSTKNPPDCLNPVHNCRTSATGRQFPANGRSFDPTMIASMKGCKTALNTKYGKNFAKGVDSVRTKMTSFGSNLRNKVGSRFGRPGGKSRRKRRKSRKKRRKSKKRKSRRRRKKSRRRRRR